MSEPSKSRGVGYGSPPTHSRFQKGQSGNPSGRPKGARSLKSDLEAELGLKVAVVENGRNRRFTKQKLLIKAVLTKAIKGDQRAASLIFSLVGRLIGEPVSDALPEEMGSADQAILDAYVAQRAASHSGGGDE